MNGGKIVTKRRRGERGVGVERRCTEHSNTSLQSFQFTESLENRMNNCTEQDRRREIQTERKREGVVKNNTW